MAVETPRTQGNLGKMTPRKAEAGNPDSPFGLPRKHNLGKSGTTNSSHSDPSNDNPGNGQKVKLGATAGIAHANSKQGKVGW